MRCSHLGKAGSALLLLVTILVMSSARAADPPSAVPLSRVVMFNSGVGFFERAGEVEGNATLELKFNVRDINDLLKSMVLQDLGGGRISTVSYGSKDPITRTLQTFAVDLTDAPTFAEILGQLRGEQVEIEATNKVTGTIVGVEKRQRAVKDDLIEIDFLTILTEEGLRSIALENVGKIKLTNAKLNAELNQALAVLAQSHATDKKSVSLSFLGQGKRPVKVGYIQDSPVWKTSYRLVLSDEKPLLQGWAIVENTTEEDWNNINLTLVSGRPISFVMDLYEPLYVDRPEERLELYASLRPRTYDQDLAAAEQDFKKAAKGEGKLGGFGMGGAGGGFGGGGFGGAPPGKRPQTPFVTSVVPALGPSGKPADGFGKQEGFQSVAQAGDVGEMFQYTIATPVSVARQRSAMLPIVNESVEGDKVSIYNGEVHAKHPLNGLRLKNTTALHLMQGPITVFDSGAYAGDAKIVALPPGSERLISYAMDLDTEVAPTSTSEPEQLLSVKLVNGTLHAVRRLERKQSYVVKNSGKKAKKVLIEWPLDTNWTLLEPKEPSEKTRGQYRFTVAADPGKPANLSIREERTTREEVLVSNLNDDAIRLYLSEKAVSGDVKTALAEVIKRKQTLAAAAVKRQELDRQIAVIFEEQTRIRQNMGQLPRDSDLYLRYIKKFNEQEDAVEKLRAAVQAAIAEQEKLQKELNLYLGSLTLQ